MQNYSRDYQEEELTYLEIIRYIIMFGLGAAITAFGLILVKTAINWFYRAFGIRFTFGFSL